MVQTVHIGDRVAVGHGIEVFVVVSIATGIATLRPRHAEAPLLDVPLERLVAAP